MDPENDHQEERLKHSLDSRLEQIARETTPPPARLPDHEPEHIQATNANSDALASLVLGIICCILFLIPCFVIPLALLGLILGLIANAKDEGSARTGIMMNIIALVLSLIFVLYLFLAGKHLAF